MDIRHQYFSIIKEKNLPNVLGIIPEISYSKKLKILTDLLGRFDEYDVKIALNLYKQNYIDLHRVQILYLKNVLVSLCNDYKTKKLGG